MTTHFLFLLHYRCMFYQQRSLAMATDFDTKEILYHELILLQNEIDLLCEN